MPIGERLELDLRDIHRKIVEGDEDARGQFYQYVQARVPRSIFRGLTEAEDLVDITAIKASLRFHLFEPPEEPEVFDKAVHGWIYTIARNTRTDLFRQRFRHLNSREATANNLIGIPFEEDSRRSEITTSLQEVLDQKARELLKPEFYSVVKLRMDGRTFPEIANELRLSEVNARQRLSRGRGRLVREFITPAGFKYVGQFGREVAEAARSGRLSSIAFLGMHYATEEAAQLYLQTRMEVDRTLLDEGYRLAREALTPKEYSALFRFQYRHLGFRKGGRLYVKPEDIDFLKNHSVRAKSPRLNPPQPGYQRLSDFAQTRREHGRLYNAIVSGNLPAIRQGHWIWTTREKVEEFIRNKATSDILP